MKGEYKAILRGDRLEWRGDGPDVTDTEAGIEVLVTPLRSAGPGSARSSDGEAMARALSKLAATGSLREVADAAEWQREQRRDRSLPGRDA